MVERETFVFSAALLGFALLSRFAQAADCTPRTNTSPCFDADALWIPAAPSRFASIPTSEALPRSSFSLGVDVVYLSRPVVLKALSADPSGRSIFVVDDVLDASLAGAYSPISHLELGVVLPMALYRNGTGLTGVTSQSGPTLTGAALRDVRLGAGHDLVLRPATNDHLRFSAMSRLELALPTGNASAFAGSRGPVVAPSFSLGLAIDSVLIGAQEGVRFQSPADFGGARIGTQFVTSLGVNVDVLHDGLLALSGEAWLSPNFRSTSRTLPDGGAVTSGALVPAEWLAMAWTRWRAVTFGVGGGTAILLSHENTTAPDGTESKEYFAGVTTPRFRFVLTARYTPAGL